MIDYAVLPTVNAMLNAVSGVFLLVGYILIRRRQINAHRNAMLGRTPRPSEVAAGNVLPW